MTTETRNEAAERLNAHLMSRDSWEAQVEALTAALAAERRATVERIRTVVIASVDEHYPSPILNNPWLPVKVINAILDEEASR